MDIIIRNGIIQKEESKRIHDIKNKEGLLKKNYENYVQGQSGPYYDFFDSHICVPRRYNEIANFNGPQTKNKIKLNYSKDFDKKIKYCCVCHSIIKCSKSYISNKDIFVEDDLYIKRKKDDFDLQNDFKRLKIEQNQQDENPIDELTNMFKKNNIDNFKKWNTLYDKLINSNNKKTLSNEHKKYINVQSKITFRYYQMIYKLIQSPILYPLSKTETKLIWPWDLTSYQKLKLNYPDYKLTPMFRHSKNYKITENYIVIE